MEIYPFSAPRRRFKRFLCLDVYLYSCFIYSVMHFSYSLKNAYFVGKCRVFIFQKLKTGENVRYILHNGMNIYKIIQNVFDRKTIYSVLSMCDSIASVRLQTALESAFCPRRENIRQENLFSYASFIQCQKVRNIQGFNIYSEHFEKKLQEQLGIVNVYREYSCIVWIV